MGVGWAQAQAMTRWSEVNHRSSEVLCTGGNFILLREKLLLSRSIVCRYIFFCIKQRTVPCCVSTKISRNSAWKNTNSIDKFHLTFILQMFPSSFSYLSQTQIHILCLIMTSSKTCFYSKLQQHVSGCIVCNVIKDRFFVDSQFLPVLASVAQWKCI